jgi:hypothetical protein
MLAGVLFTTALAPVLATHLERRRAAARVEAVAARAARWGLALDPTLSLRVRALGPLLASWETVGGCGAGGGASVGTGVKWIGHSTTGGLLQVQQQGSYVHLTGNALTGSQSPGYWYISTTQLARDLDDKWTVGLSIPVLYKYFHTPIPDVDYDISNGGLGDLSGIVTRKLGPINATSLTAILGAPTGSYRSRFVLGSYSRELDADQQLGFGRVTGTLMLDHTIDENWGLIVVGAAGGYRGGKNAASNYRAPGGSVYGYAGYFLGPLVPVLGVTATGFLKQDERGAFHETINSPVAVVAGNASVEWSTDYVALLLGAQIPFAVRGNNWSQGRGVYGLQPWTLALGISVSPF